MLKDSSSKPGWGPLAAIGFGTLAFIGPQLLLGFLYVTLNINGSASEISNSENFYLYGASSLVTLLLLHVFLTKRYDTHLRKFFGRFRGSYLAYALLALPVYMILSGILSGIMQSVNGSFDPNQAQELGFEATNGFGLLMVFVSLVIIPPIIEEVLFRGFVFRGFLKVTSPVVAAIFTSLLFGLAHMQLNVGLDTFALSLLLCYLAYKTESIWASVLLHSLKNCIAFILVYMITPEQLFLLLQRLLQS